ncbi:polysaccharide deacetylase family protein [Aquabacterium sp.]|uniref:polysaccharide deacetylase family protein n=1 Tax=Aquabacterium sp. TaxID=1872578 RepID=UPI003D6D3788
MTVASTLLRAAGGWVSPGGPTGKLTILTYHRVPSGVDPLLSNDQVDAAKFAKHMAAIADCFNVLPLPQALNHLDQGTLPSRALSITFDDGYQDNYTTALPILKRHGLKATFFVCSGYLNNGLMFNDVILESLRACQAKELDLSWLGLGLLPVYDLAAKRQASQKILDTVKYLPFNEREHACDRLWQIASPSEARPQLMMTDEQIRDLAAQGMTIGGHTHTHPILSRVDLDSARQDIALNRRLLAGLIGHEPTIFAYPNGRPVRDYGHEHVKLLKELGYQSAVSTAWGVAMKHGDRFQLPRFSPWDDDPKRLVMRLFKNAMNGQNPLVATGAS